MSAPNPDDDPRFAELMEALPEEWAHVPAESDGAEMALAFARAAYGRGYVKALEERAL